MLPFWGDPAMMRETVESVLRQTNDDWLLTVVDDAYPDPSVKEYFDALTDPRVTYVRKDVNEGITANFATCAQIATQDMVAIVGCDDVLLPNYVDTVLRAHRDFPEADIIQPGVQVIDESGAVVTTLVDSVKRRLMMPRVSEPTLLTGEPLATSLLRADWLYWPSLVFRRERLVATSFRDEFSLIQDLALIIDMICAGATLLVEPTLCFSYRRHGSSASSAALLDGVRFDGERRYFAVAAGEMSRRGWRRARRAARLHMTSRLHAVVLLPQAVSRKEGSPKALLRHAFGPALPDR